MLESRTNRRKNELKFNNMLTINSVILVIEMMRLFNHLTLNSYLVTLIGSILTISMLPTTAPNSSHEFREYLKTTCLGTGALTLISIIVITSAFSFFDSYSSMFTGLIVFSELLLSFSVGAFWILIQQFKRYRKMTTPHAI